MDSNPILNSPYDEPKLHYASTQDGSLDYQSVLKGRRPFSLDAPKPTRQPAQRTIPFPIEADGDQEHHLINLCRKEVGKWRDEVYPNTTRVTRELLHFWFVNSEREARQKLFFAQQESVETAIVVVENFRPGVMDRLGLGYEACRALNPGVVFCSVSGFGQSGPLKGNPAIDQIMDLSVIGMSGPSFGANTTQIMSGQRFGNAGALQSLKEPRFRAGILYSPVPSFNTESPREDIYGDIRMPLFHMTGTDDTSPIEGFGYERRLEVSKYSGGPEQALMVLNDGDHMVYSGSRGQLGENPKRKEHENIIKIAALAWWDAYLKDDKSARHWLLAGGFSDWLNGAGTFSYRA